MTNKLLTVALVLSLFTELALAATPSNVQYKSGSETVSAVMYQPSGKGPLPAIIVIHEWWGLNDWVKEQASKLADQGYVTLAVDLYRGKTATSPDEAHELSRALPEDRAARDLKAAFDYLAQQKNVRADRIGTIGWCMGGGYSLELAVQQPKIAATVINYGRLVTDPQRQQQISSPILGNFGGQDRGIPPDSVKKFEEEMREKGKSVDIKVYPDAGHAFQNPNNKSGYRAEDTKDSWNRIVAFFNKTLKHG